jgi:hypothetical protein
MSVLLLPGRPHKNRTAENAKRPVAQKDRLFMLLTTPPIDGTPSFKPNHVSRLEVGSGCEPPDRIVSYYAESGLDSVKVPNTAIRGGSRPAESTWPRARQQCNKHSSTTNDDNLRHLKKFRLILDCSSAPSALSGIPQRATRDQALGNQT